MMREQIIAGLIGLCLGIGCCYAQSGIPVLDKAPGHAVTFDYTYLAADGSEIASGEGRVQDNAYILTGAGIEVISDGTTRWTVDREAREVLIEAVDPADILTNPALLVSRYREAASRITVHSASGDRLDATVQLNETMSARFVLTHIAFHDKSDPADYVFDAASSGSSYLITDLR